MGLLIIVCAQTRNFYFSTSARHYSDYMHISELIFNLGRLLQTSEMVLTNSHKMILSLNDTLDSSKVFCVLNEHAIDRLVKNNMIIKTDATNDDNMSEYDLDLAELDFHADMPDLGF